MAYNGGVEPDRLDRLDLLDDFEAPLYDVGPEAEVLLLGEGGRLRTLLGRREWDRLGGTRSGADGWTTRVLIPLHEPGVEGELRERVAFFFREARRRGMRVLRVQKRSSDGAFGYAALRELPPQRGVCLKGGPSA